MDGLILNLTDLVTLRLRFEDGAFLGWLTLLPSSMFGHAAPSKFDWRSQSQLQRHVSLLLQHQHCNIDVSSTGLVTSKSTNPAIDLTAHHALLPDELDHKV